MLRVLAKHERSNLNRLSTIEIRVNLSYGACATAQAVYNRRQAKARWGEGIRRSYMNFIHAREYLQEGDVVVVTSDWLCARIRKAGEMAATLRMALDLEVA